MNFQKNSCACASEDEHSHSDHHQHSENSHQVNCGCGHSQREHHHRHEDEYSHSKHHHTSCGCSNSGHYHNHSSDDHSACGCGCEVNHGSSKQMIFQFGISAVFFIVGLVFLFAKKDLVLFKFEKLSIHLYIVLFVLAWIFAGYQVVLTSLKNILKGKIFDENFLMTVATIGAFIIGEWAEGAAVMLFYNLGELVQHSAVEKSRRSIIDLMDLRPEFARILTKEKKEIKISPDQVEVGSLVVVNAGEKIPLDGIIHTGFAEIDTASMTGESLPRSLEKGDKVLGGFVNLTGRIIIQTTKPLHETASAKMLELIEQAQNKKAKVERFITAFAKIYTPIVTIGAVLLSVLPPLFISAFYSIPINGWESFAPWVSRGLVFLVISCPCAFVISVPLGYFGGIGGAAKRGILIKGADYIDALSKTDSVVFDKTGTLTKGILKVMALMPTKYTGNFEASNEQITDSPEKYNILKFAFLVEKNSNHPIAKAIAECAAINLSKSDYENLKNTELTNYREKAGMGILGEYEGKNILIGKKSFIKEKLNEEITIPDDIAGTQVFVAHDRNYLGCIVLSDSLKDEAVLAIKNLKILKISHIEMMTGDNQKTAEYTAKELGLEHFRAELLPHEKVSNFEKISDSVKARNNKAKLVFVGDGINDAPVLARSDVGIAMGGVGSDAAIEAADVVLMNDNPNLIPKAIEISKFTRKIVWENIIFAFIIKIGFLTLGAMGFANLWAAVFADVGVALLAVINSLRAKA